MIPYFVFFTLALFFSYFSEKMYLKNYFFYYLFAICSVVTMSIFAGVRDLNIGADLPTYGNAVFNISLASTTATDAIASNPNIESGYTLLNFIISRFVSNENVFLFCMGILVYGITYFGIIQFREYCDVTLSLFFYLMFLYTLTFTLLRQGLACTIVFLAIGLFINNKKLISITLIFLSMFFHSSGIIGFLLLAMIILIKHIKGKKLEKVLTISLTISGLSAFFGVQILTLLIKYNFISMKFSSYMDASMAASSFNQTQGISIGSLYRLVFILMFFLILKEFRKNDILLFLFSALVLDFTFTLLLKGTAGLVVSRISYYFTWFAPIAYAAPLKYMSRQIISQVIKVVLVAVSIIYFIHSTTSAPVGNMSTQQIYPYTSTIIDIK